jgi:hypothetical protein
MLSNSTNYVASLSAAIQNMASALSTNSASAVAGADGTIGGYETFTVLADPTNPSLDEGTLVTTFSGLSTLMTDWPWVGPLQDYDIYLSAGNSSLAIEYFSGSGLANVDLTLQTSTGPVYFNDTLSVEDLEDFLDGDFVGEEPIEAGHQFTIQAGLYVRIGGTTVNGSNAAQAQVSGLVAAQVKDAF